jgi:hypothetical protein
MEPHLSEVNMSPGITPSSPSTERNSETYEQLVYNILNIIGAGSKRELMAE